jgi:hypothetical protein
VCKSQTGVHLEKFPMVRRTLFCRLNFNSESKSHYDRRSAGQTVLVSSQIWGPRPDFCYYQTVAVLSMWGALSDERTDVSFVAVIVSSR